MKDIFRHPLFWFGFAIKVILIGACRPWTHTAWFIPFIETFLQHPSIDPWTDFLARRGDPLSFPYGPAMLFAYAPAVAIAGQVGFAAMSFVYDLLLLGVLYSLLRPRIQSLLLFYWLSPIAIYVLYYHGQNDIVPVLLFISGLLYLHQQKPRLSGLSFALATSAKLSMIIGVPFVAIYLLRTSRVKCFIKPLFTSFILYSIVFTGLCVLSPGFRFMVFDNRELQKIYDVALPLGAHMNLYLVPVMYTVLLYGAWRLERFNQNLLFSFMGVSFFLFLAVNPASSGWYLWSLPFLVQFEMAHGIAGVFLGTLFSALYVVVNILFSKGAEIFSYSATAPLLQPAANEHLLSLLLTGLCAVAGIIGLRMFVYGIHRNDYFRLSRRPVSVGIAGDSGVGKDTLARALLDVFGDESVTHISGDDYHKWDRKAPMWKLLTHLDPRANDLQKFARDVVTLIRGKSVISRHYDHESGAFSRKNTVKRNNVILVSGLHTLFVPQVREILDVSVYLDMDESLRQHLKIQRDVHQRNRDLSNVLASIDARKPDSQQFIQPQRSDADIIFQLGPIDSDAIDDCIQKDRFTLRVELKKGSYYEALLRKLIGLCGLQVDYSLQGVHGHVEMSISGDVSEHDIELCAKRLLLEIEELFSLIPRWYNGMLGIMQLIVLLQVQESLQYRQELLKAA